MNNPTSEWRTDIAVQDGDEVLAVSRMLNKVCQVNHPGNVPVARPVCFRYCVNQGGGHLAPRP